MSQDADEFKQVVAHQEDATELWYKSQVSKRNPYEHSGRYTRDAETAILKRLEDTTTLYKCDTCRTTVKEQTCYAIRYHNDHLWHRRCYPCLEIQCIAFVRGNACTYPVGRHGHCIVCGIIHRLEYIFLGYIPEGSYLCGKCQLNDSLFGMSSDNNKDVRTSHSLTCIDEAIGIPLLASLIQEYNQHTIVDKNDLQ